MRAPLQLALPILQQQPLPLPPLPPFVQEDYIVTSVSGNKVSRRAVIFGAESVVLGGKCIICQGALVRGDLRRSPRTPAANAVMVLGRYNIIGTGAVIRPPHRITNGCAVCLQGSLYI